jgi:hypothetical protein
VSPWNSVATCAGFEAHITATTVERVSLLLVLLDNVPLVNLSVVLVLEAGVLHHRKHVWIF